MASFQLAQPHCKREPTIDNVLQFFLITVKGCNKLSNIKVLQLAHNCIIPSKVIELTSVITQNTSLETVATVGWYNFECCIILT